jgi:carboxymethylenebutenolidase
MSHSDTPDQWNSHPTDTPLFLSAEIVTYHHSGDDTLHAYVARPRAEDPSPGIVLLHHAPGWDEFYFELAERLARHGYVVMCPDLYCRIGHGYPDDVAAKVRAQGGIADDSVVADCEAALAWLRKQPDVSTKVGIMGTCSGGRHALLGASRLRGFSAVVDLWGGGVVALGDQLTPARPVAPIDYTQDLEAPLLGLFGNDDTSPSPHEVTLHENELKRLGKDYEFHRYDGAGHGIFYYHTPMYRQAAAMDGWAKIFGFLARQLKT